MALYAKKMNKVLTITAAEVNEYKTRGFDIYDGKTLKEHGAGKTVPYDKYEKVVKELEALKNKQAKAGK